MAREAYPLRATIPEVRAHFVTMVGTGAAVPTKVIGNGLTLTRTGAGDYRSTWSESPGQYVSTTSALRAATETALKNCSLVVGSWDSTNLTLDFCLFDSAGTARDLAASEWLELTVAFKPTSL